jgi:hypothetical protein
MQAMEPAVGKLQTFWTVAIICRRKLGLIPVYLTHDLGEIVTVGSIIAAKCLLCAPMMFTYS